MRVLFNNELAVVSGGNGSSNPGHNNLPMAAAEGALSALLVVGLMALAVVDTPLFPIVMNESIVLGFTLLGSAGEMALAYYDVPATYIFFNPAYSKWALS